MPDRRPPFRRTLRRAARPLKGWALGPLLPLMLPMPLAPASAHVTLEPPQALAGGRYKAVFQVRHGCAGAATHESLVHVPQDMRGVKPVPKPGWTPSLARDALATPETRHGRTGHDTVRRIRWQGGPLEDAHADVVVALLQRPTTPGPCTGGSPRPARTAAPWMGPACPGPVRRMATPAAGLDLRPAAAPPVPAHAHRSLGALRPAPPRPHAPTPPRHPATPGAAPRQAGRARPRATASGGPAHGSLPCTQPCPPAPAPCPCPRPSCGR